MTMPPIERLSVLHFRPLTSPAANVVQVVKMTGALAGLVPRVQLVTPGLPGRAARLQLESRFAIEHAFRLTAVPRWPGPARQLLYGVLAASAARLWGADMVLARCVNSAYLATQLGLPTVLELHQPIRSLPWRMQRRIVRTVTARSFRQLVVITGALRAACEADLGLAPHQVVVLPDGADPPPATMPPPAVGRRGDRPVVGYAGHLYPGKGMEIVSRLAPLCPWADFHVVGGMPADVAAWRSICGDLPNIEFHGIQPHREMVRFIAGFDVALVPNQAVVRGHQGDLDIGAWTSPLKLFEYMALSRPILCSDLPVLREVVVDGRNGLLCDAGDPARWAAALERLRSDPALAASLGANAREDLVANYTWRRRAERLLCRLDESC